MTTASSATEHLAGAAPRPSTGTLVRRGAVVGVAAAVGTTVVAAIARAAGVSLEVDGAAIPVPAFAWWSLVGAAVGVVLARILGDRRRFVAVTVSATAVSLVPAVALPDDVATTVVLVVCHLLAAAVVVPALARRLPERS